MKQTRRTPNLRARLNAVVGLLALSGTGLLARAIDVQVLRKDFYQEQGDARHLREIAIPTHRGSILDRNGEPLAVSTPVESIWANPKELIEAKDRFGELAEALGIGEDVLVQRVAQRSDREFIYLARHLDPERAKAILALGLPGVNTQREFRRYYPTGELAAHVLGFTNIDDNGQEGLELAFNDWLAGKPGAKRVIKDRKGHVVEDVELVRQAEPGRDLILSIDRRVQYLAHRELKAAMAEHNAKSGSVVVLDVASGEVLAMVNQPSYNPNARERPPGASMRNRAVTDVFEPGSVIKAFTVAAGLESGKWKPETVIDTNPGRMIVANHTVSDIRNNGVIDVTHILTKSSNVGATRIALSLPSDHLWDMFRRFGFGEATGSYFPGESPGILPDPRRWREVEKATLSYGYGLSVTPLQLAQAYGALANGGRIRAPSFVKDYANRQTAVVDPLLARTLLDMLETVTEPGGTSTRASIANYRVAGKSGTARKASAGGYDRRYVSGFVGVAPASRPRLVAVVVINEPGNAVYYGGLIAAPVFSRIMGGTLRLLNIAPDAPGLLLAVPALPDEPTLDAAAEGEGSPEAVVP